MRYSSVSNAIAAVPIFGDGVKATKLAVKHAGEVADVTGLAAKGAARACFVAGTLIHTKDDLKAIEEIQVGEHVWSHSEWDEGESSYRKVANTVQFGAKEIWEVEVGTLDGRQETYRATGNHPFWVENDSEDDHWVAAELLKTGETLRLADGSAAHVISTRNTGEMEEVYNFEVEGFHTYHIGELGVWVHNDVCLEGAFKLINSSLKSVDSFNAKPKHLPGAGGKWAKFNIGNGEELRDLIRQAIKSDSPLVLPNNSSKGAGVALIHDFGKAIGTKGQTKVRVLIGSDGVVFNALPVNVK